MIMNDKEHEFYKEYIKDIPIPQYLDVELIFNKIYYDFILSIYNNQELYYENSSEEELVSDKISNKYFFQYPYVLHDLEPIYVKDKIEYEIESIFDINDTPTANIDHINLEQLLNDTGEPKFESEIKTNQTLKQVIILDKYNEKLLSNHEELKQVNEKNLEYLDNNYSIIAQILCRLKCLNDSTDTNQ